MDAEPFEGLRVREPSPGGLGHLPIGGEVVVAALRGDGLALQVAGVVATPGRGDARCAETATDFVTQRSHSARTLVHLVCNGGL
jgi:hypothetical protein